MSKKTKASTKFVLLIPDLLDSVSKDFVLDLDEQYDDGAFAETRMHPIDDVLVALRKSFSLTYPSNPYIDDIKECLVEIRKICVDAIKPHPELLEELKLSPIPFIFDGPAETRSHLFKFALVRSKDLRVRVKFEGKRQSFFKLLEATPGDQIIRAIRLAITATFKEAHDEEQHEAILEMIRNQIWDAIGGCNEVFAELNVEPMPQWAGQEG